MTPLVNLCCDKAKFSCRSLKGDRLQGKTVRRGPFQLKRKPVLIRDIFKWHQFCHLERTLRKWSPCLAPLLGLLELSWLPESLLCTYWKWIWFVLWAAEWIRFVAGNLPFSFLPAGWEWFYQHSLNKSIHIRNATISWIQLTKSLYYKSTLFCKELLRTEKANFKTVTSEENF